MRSVLKRNTAELAWVVECPWRTEVGRVPVSLGAFFTENGDFSEGSLAAFVKQQLVPAVTAAAGKKRS